MGRGCGDWSTAGRSGRDVPRLLLSVVIAVMAVELTILGVNPIITMVLASAIALADYAIRKAPLEIRRRQR
ncbi:MAG: hypothetical protein ACP5HZ_02170 [Ferrimicrobium sp.]